MSKLSVLTYPDPVLEKTARSIELVSGVEKRLLSDMLETMYLSQGIGLAAPQVGIPKRAIVLDIGDGPIQLINPIVSKKTGSEIGEEGCLSFPGVMVKIRRAAKITFRGLDEDGRLVESEAEGLLARAIQHEIDHLDGKLIIDYVNPIKRIFLRKKLINSLKQNN